MDKKVILITGTSSGFGWLTAKICAEQGHQVYAAMRNTKAANIEKANALAQVANIIVLDVDITSTESIDKAVNTIIETHGRIDVLVNNAGVYATGITETFTSADLQKVLDVNLFGVWNCIKSVLPTMRNQGEGLIINISSVSGRFATPFMGIYNCSKFALEGLAETLRYELMPLGVEVTIVQPGAFPTEIFGKIISGSDSYLSSEYGEVANIPSQMGQGVMRMFENIKPNPQLIADAVVNLIAVPNGKRPLRTVVDVATGALVEQANNAVANQFTGFLSAFGMQDMSK